MYLQHSANIAKVSLPANATAVKHNNTFGNDCSSINAAIKVIILC